MKSQSDKPKMARSKHFGKVQPQQNHVGEIGGSIVDGNIRVSDRAIYIGGDLKMTALEFLQLFQKYEADAKKLSELLPKFHAMHAELNELKSLHDDLDQLLTALLQYKTNLDVLASDGRTVPRPRDISILLGPVSTRLKALQSSVQSLQSTCGENKIMVDSWVKDLAQLHSRVREKLSAETLGPLEGPLHYWLGMDIGWWTDLKEISNELSHTTLSYMTLVDKRLREKASDIYLQSREEIQKLANRYG